MQSVFYTCPKTREPLYKNREGLLSNNGIFYPFIKQEGVGDIPVFLVEEKQNQAVNKSLDIYNQNTSIEAYRNFLDWLFQTFNQSEKSFRRNLVEKLNLPKNGRVLITGCGLGDDISVMFDFLGFDGEVHANDLVAQMVVSTANRIKSESGKIFLSVCDAQELPYPDDYFDGAFHFGGINLFDDISQAITEMDRVTKPGCRVVFGDESVAPWLRDTEYGKAAIENNSLWGAQPPIDLLPKNSIDVHLSWVLGNCFYVIDFEVSGIGPLMNLDVPHKGSRGGTMRSRYYGRLEGVTDATKRYVISDAKNKGISVHEWLEQSIEKNKKSK